MAKRIVVGAVLGLLISSCPAWGADEVHLRVAWWSALPFAGLLLTIALLPLAAPVWWHHNRNRALVSALFAVPVASYLLYLEVVEQQHGLLALWHGVEEYLAFIILLGALYTIAGGIAVNLNLRGSPAIDSMLLLLGAALANLIGTTGAAMLLIRPYLRINRHRTLHGHLPIFFVFMVCNTGGLLTPLGDPPLFLGFLRGVDFFWTMRLWPHWLLVNGVLLGIFYLCDSMAGRREPSPDAAPAEQGPVLTVQGRINLLFLFGVIGVVLLESPSVVEALGLRGSAFGKPLGELGKILLGLLSLALTPRGVRRANDFTWGAIIEVAVIFAGIFVAIVPALQLLSSIDRAALGITKPWHYFWLTGVLSSFLDNAPTYLACVTIAAGDSPIGDLIQTAPDLLAAISCGAVFMGANTYIGNGPNFMVKAIAEEHEYPMPSFFGYLFYACLILMPLFVIVTWLFFAPQ